MINILYRYKLPAVFFDDNDNCDFDFLSSSRLAVIIIIEASMFLPNDDNNYDIIYKDIDIITFYY